MLGNTKRSEMVSVICPVYNTDIRFLAECIESVLNQSYDNFELLLVDDGSKSEATLRYIQKIECDRTDEIIRVIHHAINKGLSAARNTGINNAKGQYIAFIDSDDIFETDYLEKMVAALEGDCCDFVSCRHFDIDEQGRRKKDLRNPPDTSSIGSFHNEQVWQHLYRKDFLSKNEILFPEGKICEDISFSQKCNVLANRAKEVDYRGYGYRYVEGSISRSLKFYCLGSKQLALEYYEDCLQLFLERERRNELFEKDALEFELFITLPFYIWVSSCKCEWKERINLSRWAERLIGSCFKDINKNYLYCQKTAGTKFCRKEIWLLSRIMYRAWKLHAMDFATACITRVLSIWFSLKVKVA